MSIFRRKLSLNTGRRRSDTSGCSSTSASDEFDPAQEKRSETPRRHRRSHSLGNIFSRNRSKNSLFESYETDFWERNFSEKSTVSWNEFHAAFLLDYKHGIEEFSGTGHLSHVLKAVHDEICNKDSIVYILRYKRFIGPDPTPDAMWSKIKDNATKRVFEEGVMDSLCL